MPTFLTDESLDQLASNKDFDGLADAAASSCTTGYDNDGSTGFDIFENGFELGHDAAGRPIVCVSDDDGMVAYFFYGTVDEVRKIIEALPDDEGDDEEDDE